MALLSRDLAYGSRKFNCATHAQKIGMSALLRGIQGGSRGYSVSATSHFDLRRPIVGYAQTGNGYD